MINMRAEEAKRAALMFAKKREPELADNDDMFFDAKEYHTSNKQVANILSTAQSEAPTQQVANTADILAEADAWGDEIEIDTDIIQPEDNQEGEL